MTACSRPGPSQSHSRHTTFSRTSLDEWSAQHNPVPDKTQHSKREILAFSGIWTRNPSKWAAADPCQSQYMVTGIGKDISLAFINVVVLTKWTSHVSSNPSTYVYVCTYSENPVTFKNTAAVLEHVLNSYGSCNFGTQRNFTISLGVLC